MAICVGQIVCSALLGVPGRAARVEHAGDHPVDVEAPLRDLRDDQVRVVAVGGGDEHVGVLDAGLDQRVDLQRRADREAAARLLPRAAELDVQALMRQRVLVEDRHGVTTCQALTWQARLPRAPLRQPVTNTGRTLASGRRIGHAVADRRPNGRAGAAARTGTGPIGSSAAAWPAAAVRITRQGALLTT